MDEEIYAIAARVGRELERRGLMMASAESCTGGWVSQAMTMVPGSSEWFERGFVTYTYISKREMLGVKGTTLARHGAVSEQVVSEMARGAIRNSHAQVAVSISGIVGPAGRRGLQGEASRHGLLWLFPFARRGGHQDAPVSRRSKGHPSARCNSCAKGHPEILACGGTIELLS